MSRTFLMTSALLIGLAAPGVAVATDSKNPTPASAATDGTAKATRYCFQKPSTGTMLPTKTCRTREEWLAKGVDPLKK